MVETQSYDLTWFKVTFGCLGLKAYTKGERVLRIEATCHNAAELGCGRVLDKLPEIIARLAAMATRFCDTLDATSVGFISDAHLGRAAPTGPTRTDPESAASASTPLACAPCLAAVAALVPGAQGIHRRRPRRQGPRH